MSLKITFHQLGLGVGMDIEAALALEYRMTQHCMAGHDFFEGIRALLVDKDRKPRWQHRDARRGERGRGRRLLRRLGERELRFD